MKTRLHCPNNGPIFHGAKPKENSSFDYFFLLLEKQLTGSLYVPHDNNLG
jgi:hypothetical protein